VDEVSFGRYRLLSVIGEGGMGKVYKARDIEIGRDVAIKVLPTERAAEPGYRERFRREAHTAARLTEPHVIPIYDTGEYDQQLYLVMPVIDGVDLHALLSRDGPMTPQRAVHVIEQLAAALDAAHLVGLVHRDVKPSNALLSGRDFVYLIDFGIAHDGAATKLTQTGTIVGTWAYMAPERFTTGRSGPAADIYALACVLYECLTGTQPYPGDSLEQQFAGHFAADPPDPAALDPTLPSGFGTVIARGMAKDPDLRHRSAGELAEAARGALATASHAYPPGAPTVLDLTQPPPAPTVRARADTTHRPVAPERLAGPATSGKHRKRLWPLAAAVAAIAVAVGAGGYLMQANRPVSSTPAAPQPPAAAAAQPPAALPGPAAPPGSDGAQTVLPFTGLDNPGGIAVSRSGDLFVADAGNSRVLDLPAGAGSPSTLPVPGLGTPAAIAVDDTGAVYVACDGNSPVLRLATGSSGATELPFGGGGAARGIAVNAARDVYLADAANRLLKLPAGSVSPTTLPVGQLNSPNGIAVDTTGALYITDTGNNRILKLPAGATAPTTVPLTDLNHPTGIAVDTTGALYITDTGNNRVLKASAG
jgi:serine/threonine-protein kinase